MLIRRYTLTLVFALLTTSLNSVASPNLTSSALQTEAMIIARKFGGELKPQLKSALQAGGPLQAIEVCAEQAPAIADKLSKETGWQVKRVSLKPRNVGSATADSWESHILKQFDERRANGEPVNQITHSAQINNQYRFMKAQAVEPICLACHGSNLAPEVEQVLQKYYPEDKARGYTLGEIRGAFSLVKEMPINHAHE